MRVRCCAKPSDDIAPSLEEPGVALAARAEHRHAYLHCPWPRVGLPCLTQVPVPEWLVPQYGPMYVCFVPEQDVAESPTSQDGRSERTLAATNGPRAFGDRVEAQGRGTLHVHSLVWQLPSVDVSDPAPAAVATNDEHSSASSASLCDYVSGYCSMRDPRYRRGEGATGALKITQEEDSA